MFTSGASFAVVALLSLSLLTAAAPSAEKKQTFDIEGHRGSRGNVVESTLPAFAWALINGVKTLELDNGITKDGKVLAWHDENIDATKCSDTKPVFKDDPAFPYVGKFVANLTMAQIKTLDCGSKRLDGFPMQIKYPKTELSSMEEVFDFVKCADPKRKILWNIESKINPVDLNFTRSVDDFVTLQHAVFKKSGYLKSITYQSFDWRTLIAMKKFDKSVTLAALVDDTTVVPGTTWLAGIQTASFPGPTLDEQVAQAAASINANILSPSGTSSLSKALDPTMPGYVPFTTGAMIKEAHKLGLAVKPWTINRLNIAEQLLNWGVDGIITDYPNVFRFWASVEKKLNVAPKYDEELVLKCLKRDT